MKQLTKILVLAIVLMSIGFIGCKKQINSVENNKTDINYDMLGKEHNKYLSLYLEQKKLKTDLTFKEYYNKTVRPQLSEDLKINVKDAPSYDDLVSMLKQKNLKFSDLDDLNKVLQNVEFENIMTEEQLEILGNIIKQYGTSDEFQKKIQEFEQTVKVKSNVDQKLLLSSSNIAKYSGKLWKGNSQKNPIAGAILADAIGFGVGYVITGNWMGGLFLAIVASGEYEK